jgi:hypothetical protein
MKRTKPAPTPKPKGGFKFAVIPLATIPARMNVNPYEEEYKAAMEVADKHPQQAVVIYDALGDNVKAANRKTNLKNYIKSRKLEGKYDATHRGDKVYLWATQ